MSLGRSRATAWEPGLASWLQVIGTRTKGGVGASRRRRRQRGGGGPMVASVEGECGGRARKITLLWLRVLGSWEKSTDAVIPSRSGYREANHCYSVVNMS